ncbi:MAG: glucose-6-phosphate isomerase [Flavobacteriales bacterium]|nr:glucose-6-phosphate isomerase [Flavobacteriales bacterium]
MHESGLSPFDFEAAASRHGLQQHADRLAAQGLQTLQSQDGRVQEWVLKPEGLGWRFDFTKQCIDSAAWRGLVSLAQDAEWQKAIRAQFGGSEINATEGRAVLHAALRGDQGDPFKVGNGPVMDEVLKTRDAFLGFADDVRNGAYSASDGQPFTHVVNIGIGGSDLGPVMVHEALAPMRLKEGAPLDVRFVSNVDPHHLDQALEGLVAERTLVVIVSKTFTTQETMANAQRALGWLTSALGEKAGRHLAAVTSNIPGAGEMGISESRVFGFGNWVGGRFSLWGPVGLAIALGSGGKAFRELLRGARAMDAHFQTAEADQNVPLRMALTEVWNVNFMGHKSRAVLPYAQALHRLPAYLQQAEMESNGKAVGRDGRPVSWSTHPVVWGEPGTNGQHAFHQLLHQGTEKCPVDFLAFKEPMGEDHHMHRLLLDNAIAQAEAFCMGKAQAEVAQEMSAAGADAGAIEAVSAHRTFQGGRPSTFMLGDRLDAFSLGALVAASEHKIFLEGLFWNVFSYDQWGVELGKVLAKRLGELSDGASAQWTPGTEALKASI